jgi:hypothetical protein
MRKGKYIDYTVLLACLSKMPEQPKNSNEQNLNGNIESNIAEDTQKEKAVKMPEMEPA